MCAYGHVRIIIRGMHPQFLRKGATAILLAEAGYEPGACKVVRENAGALPAALAARFPRLASPATLVALVRPPAGDPTLERLPRRWPGYMVDTTVKVESTAGQPLRPAAGGSHRARRGAASASCRAARAPNRRTRRAPLRAAWADAPGCPCGSGPGFRFRFRVRCQRRAAADRRNLGRRCECPAHMAGAPRVGAGASAEHGGAPSRRPQRARRAGRHRCGRRVCSGAGARHAASAGATVRGHRPAVAAAAAAATAAAAGTAAAAAAAVGPAAATAAAAATAVWSAAAAAAATPLRVGRRSRSRHSDARAATAAPGQPPQQQPLAAAAAAAASGQPPQQPPPPPHSRRTAPPPPPVCRRRDGRRRAAETAAAAACAPGAPGAAAPALTVGGAGAGAACT